MDLAAHFRVIAHNWLRIVAISAVLAVVVFLASSFQSDTYAATETLSLRPGQVQGNNSLQEQGAFLAQTYAQYVKNPTVLAPAVRASKLDISLTEAKSRMSASPVGDLPFLKITAEGPTRKEAEILAQKVSSQIIITVDAARDASIQENVLPLRLQRDRLQRQLDATPLIDTATRENLQFQIQSLIASEAEAGRVPADSVKIFSGALAGEDPVAPKPARDALLGFLIALVVVSELTVLAHYVGDRFSGAEDSADVANLTGLPILAKIPRGDGIEVIEAFRVLRTNLMVLEGAGRPRTVAIVSANQAAGKTFTATHLAESAAALEEKVVLIDGDLRKPTVHERLGIPRAPGLSSVLQGGDLTAALTKVPDNPYLRVLPSGAAVQDASGMLGARSFRHVLDALRAVRLVVVDTPPANLFADASAVASQCDATIFVLDVKTSRRRAVRQALESLERSGANLIGVVVNRATVQKTASYYDG